MLGNAAPSYPHDQEGKQLIELQSLCVCVCVCVCVCACVLSLQSCLTLCDAMGSSPPGSSVHGILQARNLEWAAMPSARGSSRARDQTRISRSSCTAGRFLTAEPPEKPNNCTQTNILFFTCSITFNELLEIFNTSL